MWYIEGAKLAMFTSKKVSRSWNIVWYSCSWQSRLYLQGRSASRTLLYKTDIRTLSIISIRVRFVFWQVSCTVEDRQSWLLAATVVSILLAPLLTWWCSDVSSSRRRWRAWVWKSLSLFRIASLGLLLLTLVRRVTLLVHRSIWSLDVGVDSTNSFRISLLVPYLGKVSYLIWKDVVSLPIPLIRKIVLMTLGLQELVASLILVASISGWFVHRIWTCLSWPVARSIDVTFIVVFSRT